MRTHPLRYAALAVALLAIGGALQAQAGPQAPRRGPESRPGRGMGRGFVGLNLTEAQQAQVKAIHDRHQAAIQAKAEAADAARKAMHEAMASSATDTKTLKALHEKASAAQFDLLLEHRAVRQEILPLLTPEQKTQFETHPMGMGPGRGMHHPGGRPRHGGGPGAGPEAGREAGMGPEQGPGPDLENEAFGDLPF
jgi:Spy/CpxP family protein refolding chaperone